MKPAIRRIDRAIKKLNELDHGHRAEDYLLNKELGKGDVPRSGALFIRQDCETEGDSLALGIFFSTEVATELGGFARWRMDSLTLPQKRALAVASEEVSHFHYLLRQVSSGREVSLLEMELQGEVDAFLLSFFATSETGREEEAFDRAFLQAFDAFHLADGLSAAERERYLEANHTARRFLLKLKDELLHPETRQLALKRIRRFYRLGLSEKLSSAA